MKATVNLSQEDIKEAIAAYVRTHGWKAEAPDVAFDISAPSMDHPAHYSPGGVRATVEVSK